MLLFWSTPNNKMCKKIFMYRKYLMDIDDDKRNAEFNCNSNILLNIAKMMNDSNWSSRKCKDSSQATLGCFELLYIEIAFLTKLGIQCSCNVHYESDEPHFWQKLKFRTCFLKYLISYSCSEDPEIFKKLSDFGISCCLS